MRSYFYIETAFHHQGEKDYLIALIDEAAKIGVNGVKMQVLTKPEEFISTKHESFDKLSSYCFSEKDWSEIFAYVKSRGLDIIMMPLNYSAFDLTKRFSIRYLDLHSVSFNDETLLKGIKETGLDVLLSVGGRFFHEINRLVTYFGNQLKGVLVGFQGFPSLLKDVKLSRISYLSNKYPDLRIGYADHSRYDDYYATQSLIYARMMGATIFEKHVSLKEGDLIRADAVSAVSFGRLNKVIEEIRFIEDVILDESKIQELSDAENAYRARELKVVARRDLNGGAEITANDIALKMVSKNKSAYSRINDIVGKTVVKNIQKDDTILTKNIK